MRTLSTVVWGSVIALATGCSSEVTNNPGGAGGGATSASGPSTSAGTTSSSGGGSTTGSTTATTVTSGNGGSGGAGGSEPLTAAKCFEDIGNGEGTGPDYDQFGPVIGSHCMGTNHQDITGIEKVVFLGDSVTEGTPPTLPAEFYRNVLREDLDAAFGGVEMDNCAAWGARTDDLLIGQGQIHECFPGVENKRTLVVMTMGGNDIANWAEADLSVEEAMTAADDAAGLLRDAVEWFYADPARFPNGVFVTFANVYEYTDATGDLLSCPAAFLAGLSGNWAKGAPAVVHFQEQFMKIAVDTQTDMIFMLEHFCGHGYRRDDPNSICYRGPGSELWFDMTCTHPNPAGHAQIATMFANTILE